MAIDERLFESLARRWRAWRRRPSARDLAARFEIEPALVWLGPLARGLAQGPLALRVHEGPLRIAPSCLWLPTYEASLPEAADNAALVRVAVGFAASAAPRWRGGTGDPLAWFAWSLAFDRALGDALPGWAALRRALAEALLATRPRAHEDDRAGVAEALLQHALGRARAEAAPWLASDDLLWSSRDPEAIAVALQRWPGGALPTVPWWGTPVAEATAAAVASDPRANMLPSPTSERAARPRGPVTRTVLPEHDADENPLVHSFEKVHTAEEHGGGSKRADGADELAAHGDALDELDLTEVVLSNERVASVYRADLWLLGDAAAPVDETATGLRYDEWDEGHRRYLARFCRVVRVCPPADAAAGARLAARVRHEHRNALARVREELARVETARRWTPRQRDGSEIDLDAVVDRCGALRAGHDGDGRLYLHRRPSGHDMAVLLLLDTSSSTDGWVAQGRVLDTARDAAVVLLLALQPHVAELGIAGFCSFTHDDCRFLGIKGFREPLATGLSRLATVTPSGYTRIGPAIRHATATLAQTAARRKLLVVLTDGKPTDADRYEGRLGIADVRQALREAERIGVDAFGLAIDPRARASLPTMFGTRAWAGMPSVDALAGTAGRLLARVRLR
ncbi:MAG: VWA domain-containing protein [Nannocystaceae bacterium]|nr:VWA domain-containing protein [Nannocystaceae bacterium]